MDTILTLKQINDVFFDLTMRLLGLDPDVPKLQSRVRTAWPKDGAPAWKREEDVTFLFVNVDNDPITEQADVEHSSADDANARLTISYTRVLRITWNCYGPNSFDDIDRIRAGLFLPWAKELLASNNLAHVLHYNMPMRSPELFGGQWWERVTWYARFNNLVVRRSTVPYLTSADVQIITE